MRGGGERGHVHPKLGDDLLGGAQADTGDLIQLRHRRRERGDHLLDPGVQVGDVSGQRVDAAQHGGADERVMVVEVAGQRLS